MLCRAVLEIESPYSKAILESLLPEARDLPRTSVRISSTNDVIRAEFEALDISAMRAALNSCLGCVKVTEDITRITG